MDWRENGESQNTAKDGRDKNQRDVGKIWR